MSYRDWYVGMEVVCLDDLDGVIHPLDRGFLVVGKVYTINRIELVPAGEHVWNGETTEDIVFVTLAGNPGAFDAEAFRPVEKRKTDISVFTKLLNTKDIRELVQ